jgi:hypothetical protein
LYRCVGLNEAHDIEEYGGFRSHSAAAFEAGKWFATTYENAVRWGRRMPPINRPRSFRIASIRVSASILATLDFHDRLDGIGPAYFVPRDLLQVMNATGTLTLDAAIFQEDAYHADTA